VTTHEIDHAATMRRTRRRVILEILDGTPESSGSEISLEPVLDSRRIFGSDRQAIRTDIAWLGEQGLVTVENVGGILFCTLSASGAAIARGKRTHPDIEKAPYRWTG
jgi:hypothetical protein